MTRFSSSQNALYRPDIDGLRAVAVLLVLLFHAFPTLVPGGFVGVDVFFVISGYLISQIIFREAQAGPFSFLNFYARRFRRILPALILVLIAVWIIGWFALLAGEFVGLARHIRAGATFLSNFQLFKETGYFDLSVEYKPLLHLWSLGVEEQFYLFYPLVLVGLVRSRRNVLNCLAAIAGLSFVFNLVYIHFNPSFAFYFLPTRLWELLIGGTLAILASKLSLKNIHSLFGLTLIIASAFLFNSSLLFPDWRAILPTVGTALCIGAGNLPWVNRSVLGRQPLLLIGKISYPLYLWHWPLLSFAFIMQDGQPSAQLRVLMLLVSLVLAFLTWWMVERRAHAVPLSPALVSSCWRVLIGGFIALALVVLLAERTITYQGFPWRNPSLEPVRDFFELTATECGQKFGIQDAFCEWTSSDPKIALIGDSHALRFFAAMMSKDTPVARSLIVLGGNSCPYLTDVDSLVNSQCPRINAKIDELLMAGRIAPKVVVLFVRGPRYLIDDASYDIPFPSPSRWPMRGLVRSTKPLSPGDLLTLGLSRTIEKLERQGRKVVLFVDWPEINFNVRTCFDERPLRFERPSIKTPCAMSLSTVRERQTGYREVIDQLEKWHPSLEIFDPSPLLCDDSRCWASREGRPLYSDGSHLNMAGAKPIVPEFTRVLERLLSHSARVK